MRIIDIKLYDWFNKNRFKVLKTNLRNSASFKEQKSVLCNFYSNNEFVRDELVARKLNLEASLDIKIKDAVLSWQDVLIGFISGLISSYITTVVTEGFKSDIVKQLSFVVGFAIITVLVWSLLSAAKSKQHYIKDNAPIQEISELELATLTAILKSGESEVDFIKVMEKGEV